MSAFLPSPFYTSAFPPLSLSPSPQHMCQVHPVLSCSVMTLRSLSYSCSLCDSHLSHSAIPDHSPEGFCYFLILLLCLFWTSTIEGMISIGCTVISPSKMDVACLSKAGSSRWNTKDLKTKYLSPTTVKLAGGNLESCSSWPHFTVCHLGEVRRLPGVF